jgi:hypothetical protein
MKILRQVTLVAASAAAAIWSAVAPSAALSPGDTAPDFKAQSTLDGKISSFRLKDALAKHAVVLYFFPQAFSSG